MENMWIKGLLLGSFSIYLISGAFVIAFNRNKKLGNYFSNGLNAFAGLLGAIGAILYLFSGNNVVQLFSFNPVVPFMEVTSKVDSLSTFFILILSLVSIGVSIYSISFVEKYFNRRNTILLNSLISFFLASLFLVFTATNSIWFFIAWELMSVISYFLVVFKVELRENQKAGTLYIIMTHLGTAFLILNFMLMYSYTGTFDMNLAVADIPSHIKNIMFIFFLVGFGVKGGLVPLHIWLPHAYPAAPSSGAAIMSGVMINTSVYGMLRFVLGYLGVGETWWGLVLIIMGMISAFIGVSFAFTEKNIKRALAFSSIENLGIIFMAIGVCFVGVSHRNMPLASVGLLAALVHALNHSLFKSGLFLAAGSIHYATNTRNMDKLGGLIKKMPISSVIFLGLALSISGIVPFNGFLGEWLTFQALFSNVLSGDIAIDLVSLLSIASLAFAGALAAGTFVKIFGISFLGLPRTVSSQEAHEVPLFMNVGTGFLAGLCLLLGLVPALAIRLGDAVRQSLIHHSMLGNLDPNFFMMTTTVHVQRNEITPILAVFLGGLILAALYFGIRQYQKGRVIRKYGTWDCGYEKLTPRMQYTGAGYSKPLSITFRFLFRPVRKLTKRGEHLYHPERMEYEVKTEPIFEKFIYEPVHEMLKTISKKAREKIQTGSIHAYLIYIFMAVLVLMLYNRFA